MKVLNYGSLNIDYVYGVENFVADGETINSLSYDIYAGGKGLNQSVALSRAGFNVYHAGKIGNDGLFLKKLLDDENIDTSNIRVYDKESGHAVIQVDAAGRNSIIVHGGANRRIERAEIDSCLFHFSKGDVLILQNETNKISYLIDEAYRREMFIAINPAPMNEAVKSYPLDKVSLLILNENEGHSLAKETDPFKLIEVLHKAYPKPTILLTLGKEGSLCFHNGKLYRQGIYKVKAIDTIAAGDTFCGYFLKSFLEGCGVGCALDTAARAAAICVSRKGAATSIPFPEELTQFYNK